MRPDADNPINTLGNAKRMARNLAQPTPARNSALREHQPNPTCRGPLCSFSGSISQLSGKWGRRRFEIVQRNSPDVVRCNRFRPQRHPETLNAAAVSASQPAGGRVGGRDGTNDWRHRGDSAAKPQNTRAADESLTVVVRHLQFEAPCDCIAYIIPGPSKEYRCKQ
jgi:hypothetical protein